MQNSQNEQKTWGKYLFGGSFFFTPAPYWERKWFFKNIEFKTKTRSVDSSFGGYNTKTIVVFVVYVGSVPEYVINETLTSNYLVC